MDKLDEDRNSGRLSLARPRDLGGSVLRSPPPNAKPWMITLPTTSQAAEENDDDVSPQSGHDISDEEDM